MSHGKKTCHGKSRHAVAHGTDIRSQIYQPGAAAVDVVWIVPWRQRWFRLGKIPSKASNMGISWDYISD